MVEKTVSKHDWKVCLTTMPGWCADVLSEAKYPKSWRLSGSTNTRQSALSGVVALTRSNAMQRQLLPSGCFEGQTGGREGRREERGNKGWILVPSQSYISSLHVSPSCPDLRTSRQALACIRALSIPGGSSRLVR